MTTQRWRVGLWITSVILMVVLAFQWSQLATIQSDGKARVGYHLGLWLTMLVSVFAFPRLDKKAALLFLISAAVLVRLAFWQAPVSDDVNRYLWESSLIWKGENPYATVVDDEIWKEYRDEIWKDVNHRDRLTAYPPGVELIFAAGSWLWYDLQVYKIIALLGDLWVLIMLAALLITRGKPLRWLGFYAFNPIVLAAFAAEAHFDSLMVGAMLTALWMAEPKEGSPRAGWAWFWLGFAVQIKIIVAALVPYFIVRLGWKKCLPFVAVLILPSLVFGEHLMQSLVGLFGFGKAGAFNGGLYESLRWLGLSDGVSRNTGFLLFVTIGLFYGWRTLRGRETDLVRLSFIIMAALVVCSPVAHFWYFTWLIPFVVLRPSLSWIVLSGTTAVYFMAWEGLKEADGAWGYQREWVVLTWLPFFVLLVWELRFLKRRLTSPNYSAPTTMDLVVPVFNAAEKLPAFFANHDEGKIIVVDGGSSDDSVKIAQAHGATVLVAGLGRGEQIAAGVVESDADLVAIVHADTLPLKGWREGVLEAFIASPTCPALAIGQRFSRGGLGLLFVEVLNEARAIFGGSVFGDQTLIVRREALADVGGFPDQPLMEDVEVSWRLLERGEIRYLGNEWVVSAVKWKGRFLPRFRQVISLMIRYRWKRLKSRETAAEYSRALYREYYGKG